MFSRPFKGCLKGTAFSPSPLPSTGTPSGVRYEEVRGSLLTVTGVTAVHNLHIWALTMNQVVLSAHVAIGESAAPPSQRR